LNSLTPSSLSSCSFFNLLDLAEGGDIAILMEGGMLFLEYELEVFSWRSFAFLVQLLVVRNNAASGSLLSFCVCIPFIFFEINTLPIHFNLDLVGLWLKGFNLFILLIDSCFCWLDRLARLGSMEEATMRLSSYHLTIAEFAHLNVLEVMMVGF